MTTTDIIALATAAQKGGVGTLALIVAAVIVLGAIRGWWVPGQRYNRLEKRCDRWQQLALSALNDADHGAALADFYRETSRD